MKSKCDLSDLPIINAQIFKWTGLYKYEPDYPFNERAGVLVRNLVYVIR